MAGSCVKFASALLISIFLAASIASFTAEASISSKVDEAARECMPYVMDKAPSVTFSCCSAMEDLASNLNTPENKKQACECLKAIASKMPGIDYNRVKAVPGNCGIKFPLPLDPSAKC